MNDIEQLKKQLTADLEKAEKLGSFSELVSSIIGDDSAMTFANKTLLSPNMATRLKYRANESSPPLLSTVISLCVGYNVHISYAEELLKRLGLSFNNRKRRDYAYIMLLTHKRNISIEEANDILVDLGFSDFDLLGSKERRRHNMA